MSSATDIDPSSLVHRTPTLQLTGGRYRRSKRRGASTAIADNGTHNTAIAFGKPGDNAIVSPNTPTPAAGRAYSEQTIGSH
jgi:hypothetical protein